MEGSEECSRQVGLNFQGFSLVDRSSRAEAVVAQRCEFVRYS